jgi:hypothetical protein
MDFFADGLDSIVDSNLFFMKGDKWKNSKVNYFCLHQLEKN